MERFALFDYAENSIEYVNRQKALLWRRSRLCILFALLLIPIFGLLDLVVTPALVSSLLPLRVMAELGFLLLLLGVGTPIGSKHPEFVLVIYYALGGWLMAHLSAHTGGFESFHAKSLIFLLVGVSVLVPVRADLHAIGQGLALGYYVFLNARDTAAGVQTILQNSYLFWLCVLCDVAVYMYDRLQNAEYSARHELEASNVKLLELDRMKNELFANVSHEFRTPLALIMGSLHTLRKAPLGATLDAAVEAGLRNSGRLLLLINNLLDLARSQSGRVTLVKECTDLSALVRQACANFASSSSDRQLHAEIENGILAEVDIRHMKQVMYNLLSNAWKFTDSGHREVWVRLQAHDGNIELQVKDNGIGIPARDLERIFDRFYQVQGSATRRYEGAGIGLALVRDSLERHGGTIHVESAIGRGTSFTVTLPQGHIGPTYVAAGDEASIESKALPPTATTACQDQHGSRQPCTRFSDKRPLVLIADDHVDFCSYLAAILSPHFGIAVAHDGREALACTQALQPDLIVTDIMMPRMSGYDLLRAIRGDPLLRAIPIIVLTAKAGPEAVLESLDVGANDYLAKPFEERELLARVRTHLRAHAQERELELANQKLQELDQQKSVFVSVVSHELRTPMTALKGYLENMLDEIGGPLTEKQRQYLTRMQFSINRLIRMVNDLLDLSRIESGRVEMNVTSISTADVIRDVVELLQPVAQTKGVKLSGHVEGEPTEIYADRDKLHQVFTNLIQNAIKFTPSGGDVRLMGHATAQGNVVFRVIDTGCGIGSDELIKIFEPFYRGDAAAQFEQRGAGLGLAITKRLVELHGGKLWVESEPGKGSVFYCSMPCYPDS